MIVMIRYMELKVKTWDSSLFWRRLVFLGTPHGSPSNFTVKLAGEIKEFMTFKERMGVWLSSGCFTFALFHRAWGSSIDQRQTRQVKSMFLLPHVDINKKCGVYLVSKCTVVISHMMAGEISCHAYRQNNVVGKRLSYNSNKISSFWKKETHFSNKYSALKTLNFVQSCVIDYPIIISVDSHSTLNTASNRCQCLVRPKGRSHSDRWHHFLWRLRKIRYLSSSTN